MAKFTKEDFLRGAQGALSQQNFPAVYKNAIAALALGAPQAAFFLCVFYHHQIVTGAEQEVPGIPTTVAQFGAMYQVSEHFKINGYTQFTHAYQNFFGFGDNKMPLVIQEGVKIMSTEYIQYLQVTPSLYPEGARFDIIQAEGAAGAMEQVVLERGMTQKQRAVQPLEISAPPHDYHHHQQEQSPLLGQQHHEKCWDKLPCVLL